MNYLILGGARSGKSRHAELAVPIIQSALRLHRGMATFADAGDAAGG